MKKKKLFVFLLLLAEMIFLSDLQAEGLTHVKGIHTIGVRGGIGTKNKYDYGIIYHYHFNAQSALSAEIDHEIATFGHTDFTGIVLLSPGFNYSPANPWGWSYITLNLAASVGWDKWECKEINKEICGIVYGANAGVAWEIYPRSFLSIEIKAQEYILFGNDDQYIKPLFSLGVCYNFHK